MIGSRQETQHGVYYPSDLEDLREPFKKYLKHKSFLDLGAGKGEVVELANECGALANGIEIDEAFYSVSDKRWNYFDDMFNLDWSKFNALYYYLWGSNQEERITDKLNAECKGLCFIYTGKMPEKFTKAFTDRLTLKLIDEFSNLKVYSK